MYRVIFYKCRCAHMRPVFALVRHKNRRLRPHRRRLFARPMLFSCPFRALSARRKRKEDFTRVNFLETRGARLGYKLFLFRDKFFFSRRTNVTFYSPLSLFLARVRARYRADCNSANIIVRARTHAVSLVAQEILIATYADVSKRKG